VPPKTRARLAPKPLPLLDSAAMADSETPGVERWGALALKPRAMPVKKASWNGCSGARRQHAARSPRPLVTPRRRARLGKARDEEPRREREGQGSAPNGGGGRARRHSRTRQRSHRSNERKHRHQLGDDRGRQRLPMHRRDARGHEPRAPLHPSCLRSGDRVDARGWRDGRSGSKGARHPRIDAEWVDEQAVRESKQSGGPRRRDRLRNPRTNRPRDRRARRGCRNWRDDYRVRACPSSKAWCSGEGRRGGTGEERGPLRT